MQPAWRIYLTLVLAAVWLVMAVTAFTQGNTPIALLCLAMSVMNGFMFSRFRRPG